MGIYCKFAEIYDALMFDAPYDDWVCQIDKWISPKVPLEGQARRENGEPWVGAQSKIVVDLGCGTGSVSMRLAKMGYSVIGVDSSAEMLGVAYEKASEANAGLLLVHQDMRELDLYGTAGAFVSVCDAMNYILDEAGLQRVFERVYMFMDPGGIFIFDMNTRHKFGGMMGGRTFSGTGLNGEFYTWKNEFCEKTMLNKYEVVFYGGAEGGVFTETHLQRAYGSEAVAGLLKRAGFRSIEAKCGDTDEPLCEDCMRAVYIARKN